MYLLDDTEASLIIDDFTKEKSIQITKVAGNTQNLFVDTFEFYEENGLIRGSKKVSFQFAFHDGQFLLRINGVVNTGDILYFLFDDKQIITKTIANSPPLHRATFATTIPLTSEEMKLFATIFLEKWKLTSVALNTFQIGGFIDKIFLSDLNKQYPTSEEGQYLLLLTARQLIKQVILHFPKLHYEDLLIQNTK